MVKLNTDNVQFLSYEFQFIKNENRCFKISQGYSNKFIEHTSIEDRILRIANYEF